MAAQIVSVIHCDFLSLYPTDWELASAGANGFRHYDDVERVRKLIELPRDTLVERLRQKDGWRDLNAIVQVLPDRDLFPVRAQYPGADVPTIGLNFLSADESIWFTLGLRPD